MQNFSAICTAVRRPFQKNSRGVAPTPPPPALARVKNWLEIKIPRYTFYRYGCPYQLLKVSYWYLKNCSHGEILNIFVGRFTWPDLVTWPEMTFGWNFWKGAKLMYEKVGKKQLVWSKWSPPTVRRLNVGVTYETSSTYLQVRCGRG